MRRFMIFGALSFFIFVTIMFFVVSDIKSARPAILHLKPNIAEGGDRDGKVTTTDKYVTVETDTHGKEIFTWDQILYISDKDLSSSKKLDQIVDLIDLLSKFGLLATVLFFMVGLYQYGQTQKWEREKFLATIVKEFIEWKQNGNAMHMIDSLALYRVGRMVELFPDEEKSKDRKVFVTNEEICAALTPTPQDDLDQDDVRAIAIRDCFDSFLSFMGTFYHYVEHGLITKEALSAQVGYWFELFGPKGKISPAYKKRVLGYGRTYGLNDFERLVGKYNRPSLWERFMGFFIR